MWRKAKLSWIRCDRTCLFSEELREGCQHCFTFRVGEMAQFFDKAAFVDGADLIESYLAFGALE